MPKLPRWLTHKKTEYERALDPKSLAPSSMIKEVKAAALILGIFFGGIVAVLVAGKYYMWDSDTFIFAMVMATAIDFAALAGYAGLDYLNAVRIPLFDCEFGYRGSLRVRHELYIDKQNVRKLLTTEDKIQDRDTLLSNIDKFVADTKAKEKLKTIFSKEFKSPMNLSYFYFPNIPVEGWDKDKETRPIFTTMMLFHPKPVDEQFIFAQGHDNWYGNLYINHPHAESLNVKVVTWTLDPFTSQPMPICLLKHSSINYDDNKEEESDVKIVEALSTMVVKQHSIIEAFRRDNTQKEVLLEAKFHDDVNNISYGHEIADVDMNYFQGIMKKVTHGLWGRLGNLGKILVSIVLIAAVVIVVWLVLSWLGFAHMP